MDTYYRCATQQAYNELMVTLKSQGFTWAGGQDLTDDLSKWLDYGRATVIKTTDALTVYKAPVYLLKREDPHLDILELETSAPTQPEFAAFIASIPSTTYENPYWVFTNGVKGRFDPYLKKQLSTLLPQIKQLFHAYYLTHEAEMQVAIVPKGQDTGFDVVTSIDHPLFDVVLPPQENSWGNTHVSDAVWHKAFGAPNVPIARVHSHHTLSAYQSKTDYESLNSGTLEIVIGKVDQPGLTAVYWLSDHQDTAIKSHVYEWTTDLKLANPNA